MAEHTKAGQDVTPDPPTGETMQESSPMPTPFYHPRRYYVQWCPADTGGGNYAVCDRYDDSYIYSAPDEADGFTGKHEADCTRRAADLNLKQMDEHYRAEIERLHERYLARLRTACDLIGPMIVAAVDEPRT